MDALTLGANYLRIYRQWEQIICGYVDNGNLLFADAMYRVPTFAVSEQLVEGASAGF